MSVSNKRPIQFQIFSSKYQTNKISILILVNQIFRVFINISELFIDKKIILPKSFGQLKFYLYIYPLTWYYFLVIALFFMKIILSFFRCHYKIEMYQEKFTIYYIAFENRLEITSFILNKLILLLL